MSEVIVVRDAAEGAQAAAEVFVEATAGAVAARGTAGVALTGGSSASPLYAALRAAPFRDKVPWGSLELFCGDERAVPVEDARSNAGVALRELVPSVPFDPARFHRFRGEATDLEAEAARCASDVRATLARPGLPPRFDLVLLGLGSDGHVLSLFAGVASSAERGDDVLVRALAPPLALEPKVARLSLVPLLLVNARCVLVQAAGAAKAEVLRRALLGEEDLVACPAQWLRRASGRVIVVADAAAAARLS